MTLACYDCGLPYKSLRFADFVVADDVWEQISPTGNSSGILCVGCMIERCAISGIKCEGSFTSGPFANHDWKKPPRAASESKRRRAGEE